MVRGEIRWEAFSHNHYHAGQHHHGQYHHLRTSLIELVSNIWLDIVHTMKGQWDGIVGDSDTKIAQRHEFIIV